MLSLSFLDAIIIAVLLFYAFEGLELGFVAAFLDLVSFVASFIVGLRLYGIVGGALALLFQVPLGFAQAGAFFFVAVVSEIAIGFALRFFIGKRYAAFTRSTEEEMLSSHVPRVFQASLISLNRFLGVIPGLLSAFIILSFLLSIIIALPLSPFLKHSVSDSKFGKSMLVATQSFEGKLNDVFGLAISESLNFLTVKPQSSEFISLNFKTTNVSLNEAAEEEMFELVNKEREKHGLQLLEFDKDLQNVAQKHSRDMFARGYFSHYSPEGQSPFDRMNKDGISFSVAGENVALAPSIALAMQGFMNSPGHKANMLSDTFGKIGIGAVDGGIYGIMFSQEFTD